MPTHWSEVAIGERSLSLHQRSLSFTYSLMFNIINHVNLTKICNISVICMISVRNNFSYRFLGMQFCASPVWRFLVSILSLSVFLFFHSTNIRVIYIAEVISICVCVKQQQTLKSSQAKQVVEKHTNSIEQIHTSCLYAH